MTMERRQNDNRVDQLQQPRGGQSMTQRGGRQMTETMNCNDSDNA